MKAYVSVQNFGSDQEKADLCVIINRLTLFHAFVNDKGNVVIPCRSYELGNLFSQLEANQLNWIEYTVQFDY